MSENTNPLALSADCPVYPPFVAQAIAVSESVLERYIVQWNVEGGLKAQVLDRDLGSNAPPIFIGTLADADEYVEVQYSLALLKALNPTPAMVEAGQAYIARQRHSTLSASELFRLMLNVGLEEKPAP